jgi:hypothetical protein
MRGEASGGCPGVDAGRLDYVKVEAEPTSAHGFEA